MTRSLLVTAGITVVGTLLSLVFTSMLAYGLTRTRQVPFSKAAIVMVLCTMFFGAGIIPNYLLIKQLGLLDSYWALILPGLISAFNHDRDEELLHGVAAEVAKSAGSTGDSEFGSSRRSCAAVRRSSP